MDDAQVIAALERDDSYSVVKTLADRPSGRTELVRGDGAGLLVRKYVPVELANETAWRRLEEADSPLLPQVHDVYWLPDRLVVVTDYVDGISLAELVGSTGALDAQFAVGYACDVAKGLAALHELGLVHRDVSPGNVVVSAGQARLIDLGNARAYAQGASHDTTRLGTWGFAAPEQFGFAQSDARSDVYALGSLLGHLLTGVQPGDDAFEQALDKADLPRALVAVVARARSFEPSARFQTAAEFAEAARAALSDAVIVEPILLGTLEAEGGAEALEPAAQPVMRDGAGVLAAAEDGAPRADTLLKRIRAFPEACLRAWRSLGEGRRVWAVVRWAFTALFAALFIAAGFDPENVKTTGDSVYFPLAGVICAGCLIACAVELQLRDAARAQGRLPVAQSGIGPALFTIGKWVLFAFIGVVVDAILINLIIAA